MAAKPTKLKDVIDSKDLADVKRLVARIELSKKTIAQHRDLLREFTSDLKEILFRDGEEVAESAEDSVYYLGEATDRLSQLL